MQILTEQRNEVKETLYIEAIYEEASVVSELIMSRVLITMKNDDDISLSILAVAGLL